MYEFNESNFDAEVLQSDVPVIVCFSAVWCGPCKAVAPILVQVAAEIGSEGRVGKVDIDESPILASQFGIRGVPTILLFKNGEFAGKLSRPATKANLLELIRR